jgi:hypothetical protein
MLKLPSDYAEPTVDISGGTPKLLLIPILIPLIKKAPIVAAVSYKVSKLAPQAKTAIQSYGVYAMQKGLPSVAQKILLDNHKQIFDTTLR